MAMTQEQARDILYRISLFYDMEFQKNEMKYKMWRDKLAEKGDYEKSKRKVEAYIEEYRFKPSLSDILAKLPVYVNDTPEELSEERKEHLWRMENDEAYRQEREDIKNKYKAQFESLAGNKVNNMSQE